MATGRWDGGAEAVSRWVSEEAELAEVAHLQAVAADDPAERAARLGAAGRWNAAASRFAATRLPRALREQAAVVAELGGDRAGADRHRREAAGLPPDSARDLFLLGSLYARRGDHRQALPHLEKSTHLDPKNFSAWFVRGTTHLALGQCHEAVAAFTGCLALRDDFAPAWLNRGLAHARLGAADRALADYDRAVALDPAPAEAYTQRAAARDSRGDLAGAEADLTRALEAGGSPVRVRLLRADVRGRAKNPVGAAADRAEALRLEPADPLGWIGRAEARLGDDPKGALADVDEALAIDPFSVHGLQLKAHILGERLGRADDALAVLDRAVELHPDHVPVRAGRGVELARRGKRDGALADARAALVRDSSPPNLYQSACIYSLTSAVGKGFAEDRVEALRLLRAALRGGFGADLVAADRDLDPVRKDPAFAPLLDDVRRPGSGER